MRIRVKIFHIAEMWLFLTLFSQKFQIVHEQIFKSSIGVSTYLRQNEFSILYYFLKFMSILEVLYFCAKMANRIAGFLAAQFSSVNISSTVNLFIYNWWIYDFLYEFSIIYNDNWRLNGSFAFKFRKSHLLRFYPLFPTKVIRSCVSFK